MHHDSYLHMTFSQILSHLANHVTPFLLNSESDSELEMEGSSEEEVLEPNRKLPSPIPHPPTSQTPQLIQVGRPHSKKGKVEEEEDSPWDRWVR